MPATFNKAIPLFFHLASDAFPDNGLVGRIEEKKKKKHRKKNSQEVSEALVPQGDVKG